MTRCELDLDNNGMDLQNIDSFEVQPMEDESIDHEDNDLLDENYGQDEQVDSLEQDQQIGNNSRVLETTCISGPSQILKQMKNEPEDLFPMLEDTSQGRSLLP